MGDGQTPDGASDDHSSDELDEDDAEAATEGEPDETDEEESDTGRADGSSAGTDVLAFDEDATPDEEAADAAPAETLEKMDADGSDTDDDTDGTEADGVGTDADTDRSVTGGGDTERTDGDDSTGESAGETKLERVGETDVDGHDTDGETRPDTLDESESALDSVRSDESDSSAESERETDAEPAQSISDDVTEFEFDDGPVEDDVSVEEAVETSNEDAPAPELSSHKFDVTAEVHEDGEGNSAMLVFEFDPTTVDISGSTKRLLQYQMRSFADREETPNGDVSIGQQRIVVEIPDSDGDARPALGGSGRQHHRSDAVPL